MATKKQIKKDIKVKTKVEKKEDLQKSFTHERPEPNDFPPAKRPVSRQIQEEDTPIECSFMPAKLKDGALVVVITLGEKKISVPIEQFLAIAIQVQKFYVVEKNKDKSIITPPGTTRDKKIIIP